MTKNTKIAVGIIAAVIVSACIFWVNTDYKKPISNLHYDRYVKLADYVGQPKPKEKGTNSATLALEAVVDKSKIIKWPKEILEKEIDKVDKDERTNAKMYDVSFSTYLDSFLGINKKEYKERIKLMAQDTVKTNLVTYYIAKKEKIKLSKLGTM